MDDSTLQKLRLETPGTQHVVHFNNAGCSLPSKLVLDSMTKFLNEESLYGGYETFDKYSHDLNRAPYQALATLLNCHEDEIAITTSNTDAWQQIFYGLAWTWKPNQVILTSHHEYGSNYISYLQISQRTGIKILIVPETSRGDVCLDALEKLLLEYKETVVLITMSHIPTSSGCVYDVHGVGKLAQRFNVPFLLDACQSVGHLPLDVKEIGCSFLTATGRKYLRAPRGTGFLYCSRDALNLTSTSSTTWEPATLDNTGAVWTHIDTYTLQPTAKRFERYEMTFAAKYGLLMATRQCLEVGIDIIWKRIRALSELMRNELSALSDRIRVVDHGVVLCGIVTFVAQGYTADSVQKYLSEKKINTSVSRVRSSRIELESKGLEAVVRASVHYYNDENEVFVLIRALKDLVSN